MKKIITLLVLAGAIILAFYISSTAKQRKDWRPEDKAGKEASAFMPEKAKGEPVAKGTKDLKVTGPVYDLDTK